MELNPRSKDLREEKRRRMFGPDAACILGGETHPLVSHHLPGRHNDPMLEGPFCANHHIIAHEALADAGVDLHRDSSRTPLECLQAVIRSLATFFELLAERLHEWAGWLAVFITRLDQEVPEWRSWEVAEA